MSDLLRMNGPGLPAEILHALVPRPHPVDPPAPSHRIQPAPDAGAEFSSTQDDVSARGDQQLLSELRMLAELHRVHQAAKSAQGKESSNVVASWIRDEKLESMIPNPPKITSGKVIAHSNGVTVA